MASPAVRVREEGNADRYPVWDGPDSSGDREGHAAPSNRGRLAARSRALEAAACVLPDVLASESPREEVLELGAAVLRALDDRVADALGHFLRARADLAVTDFLGARLNLLGRRLHLRVVSRTSRQGRACEHRCGQDRE